MAGGRRLIVTCRIFLPKEGRKGSHLDRTNPELLKNNLEHKSLIRKSTPKRPLPSVSIRLSSPFDEIGLMVLFTWCTVSILEANNGVNDWLKCHLLFVWVDFELWVIRKNEESLHHTSKLYHIVKEWEIENRCDGWNTVTDELLKGAIRSLAFYFVTNQPTRKVILPHPDCNLLYKSWEGQKNDWSS